MKLANTVQQINQIKQIKDWFLFLKRKGPYYPYPILVMMRGFTEGWKNNFKIFYFKLAIYLFRDDGWLETYYPTKDFEKFKKIVFNKIKNEKDFVTKMLLRCKKETDVLLKVSKRLQQVNFDNKELCYKTLTEFHKMYIKSTVSGYIAWWGGREALTESLERYLTRKVGKSLVNDYFSILSSPLTPSFIFQERYSLLKIAHKSERHADIIEDLKLHTKQFAWIPFDYNGPALYGRAHFNKELKKIIKTGNFHQEFKKAKNHFNDLKIKQIGLFKKLKIDSYHKRLFKDLQTMIWHQDFKKEAYTKVHLTIWCFLKKIARFRKIYLKNLLYLNPAELENFILTNQLDLTKIRHRTKYCLTIIRSKGTETLTGAKANIITKIVTTNNHNLQDEKFTYGQSVIRGQVASMGNISGKVKIIFDPQKVNTMISNSILVTRMTTPSFIPAMRQAAAIITDEGGITCHAAIVSRELGIPCIIGTKIATKVLKDGDLVEVDAERGVVRIIR